MARRINKNQYGYRHPQEEIERARATAYRAPSRISPAQVAAMAQVKNPLQLGLTTLGRRAGRAVAPIDRAGNATAGLLGNIGGLVTEPAKQGLRSYFQNANDQGELKSIMPVLGAMGQGFMQSAKKLPASTKEFGSAMAGAYEPTKDLLGAIAELGYSNVLYPAGKAINQYGNQAIGQGYRRTRDALMPYLNDEKTQGGNPTYKRATMCKCGSGMSKSMCKCGAKGKTTKKRALRKADYFVNGAPSQTPPKSSVPKAYQDQFTDVEWNNLMERLQSQRKSSLRPRKQLFPFTSDSSSIYNGKQIYDPFNPYVGGQKGLRKKPRPFNPTFDDGTSTNGGIANSSMVKRSLRKRQAGPKPHKYF